MKETLKEELQKMGDDEMFYFLREVLTDRVLDWGEATTNYDEATLHAKLAVIKHILCN